MQKSTTTPLPLYILGKKKENINIRPVFQRNFVWNKSNKQLFIDSIVRNYYVPELIFGKDQEGQYEFIVIDGQQRLGTIFEFMNDSLRIANNTIIKNVDISNLTYSKLPETIKNDFDSYLINYVLIDGTYEELQDMFIRLQNQVNLTKAEQRHAIANPIQDFILQLINHDFFVKTCEINNKTNKRMKYNEVLEQFILLELYGVVDIKDSNLRKMYDDYQNGIIIDIQEKVIKVLDYMFKAFGENYAKSYFRKVNLHGLYLVLTDYYNQDKEFKNTEKFGNWFIEFENLRRDEKDLPPAEKSEYIREYEDALSSGTGSKVSLEKRKAILKESLKEYLKSLRNKRNKEGL